MRGRTDVRAQLAAHFQQQAFGGLLADAGHAGQAARFLQGDGLRQIRHRHAREHRQRRAGADAADRDQFAKGAAFAGP
ncbi:hypothetical protein G6F59_018106 [Rhizopus arrhizus]|nr:hypothetical protein G6F59_018106 [Rhizopus arrhizus]